LPARIKVGNQDPTFALHSIFAAGIAFLLRRKLGKIDVSAEVAAVIKATLESLQTSAAFASLKLPQLIVQVVHVQFPSPACSIASASSASNANKKVEIVLAQLSPLERNILLEYYRGCTPDSIQSRLSISSEIIKETLAKTRSIFLQRRKP
jgi:DNA-directed RNA polymerase specialized sigma24 family protein